MRGLLKCAEESNAPKPTLPHFNWPPGEELGAALQQGPYIKDFHAIRNPVVRMNGVCPYFTMYPLTFPYSKLRAAKPRRVLDPFCGRGTTNFAARLLGIESVGIDSNPVAFAVAQSKLSSASASQVVRECRKALRQEEPDVPQGDFWELCYHPDTLIELCSLRTHLLRNTSDSDATALLRSIALGLLHGPLTKGLPTYFSNQMPRTYATKPRSAVAYWTKRNLKPRYVSVEEALARRATYLLAHVLPKTKGHAIAGDSREASTFKGLSDFDLVITSPPYLGMTTYGPDQWLRNWFVGGPDAVDYVQPRQMGSSNSESFVEDLAAVWRNVAGSCKRGARMVVRFGALPSCPSDPSLVLSQSIKMADCGWRPVTKKSAGLASAGKRQANQFQKTDTPPISEIDLYCVLE